MKTNPRYVKSVVSYYLQTLKVNQDGIESTASTAIVKEIGKGKRD
jgi:hypothetical protein